MLARKQLSHCDVIVDLKKFQSRRKVHCLWVGLLVWPIWSCNPYSHIKKWKNIFIEKCVCWRRGHNVLEWKCSKSGIFSLIFVLNSLWHYKESFLWSEHGWHIPEKCRTEDLRGGAFSIRLFEAYCLWCAQGENPGVFTPCVAAFFHWKINYFQNGKTALQNAQLILKDGDVTITHSSPTLQKLTSISGSPQKEGAFCILWWFHFTKLGFELVLFLEWQSCFYQNYLTIE